MKSFYDFTVKERLMILLYGLAIILLLAYFFYRSLWAVPLLSPLLFIYQKMAKENLRLKKQKELTQSFKEMIEIVAGNLRAGYSVENAFLEMGKETLRLKQKEAPEVKMVTFIKRGIENNIVLNERLREAGEISGISEIMEFAEVFSVAKNSGGGMIDSISQFAAMIGDKIETEKEISVILSARRGEQKIMNIVPFIILIYLDITSPGFFSPLYHNLIGIVTMTACLALYLCAYYMAQKMLRIEV
ncbi:MAG: hypothetical protein FWG91_02405 [Lachnospiraceae bacterium]|nr:hypothetical protein [Lachnospiraceae bacterium]